MNEKNKLTKAKAKAWVITILFASCIGVWSVMFFVNASSYQTHIPFATIHAEDLDPDTLVNDIMKAIGYPNAVPIVTKQDSFWAVLHNQPQQNNDMKLHSIASSFRVRVSEKGEDRLLSYQLQTSRDGGLVIIYGDEIKFVGRPNELPPPSSGYSLINLFSAIRDFPAVSYRELTNYGSESADLYQIQFGNALLHGESFSYGTHGPNHKDNNEEGIPFIISHMKWGKVRDDSLEKDDPNRYLSYGGEGRANLRYVPEGQSFQDRGGDDHACQQASHRDF